MRRARVDKSFDASHARNEALRKTYPRQPSTRVEKHFAKEQTRRWLTPELGVAPLNCRRNLSRKPMVCSFIHAPQEREGTVLPTTSERECTGRAHESRGPIIGFPHFEGFLQPSIIQLFSAQLLACLAAACLSLGISSLLLNRSWTVNLVIDKHIPSPVW